MKFDLSSIPTNATVTSASLQMYAFWKNGTNGFPFSIYKISKAWNENYTTWTAYDQGSNWNNGGGDYGTKVASFSSPGGYDVPKWDNFDMKNAVQGAVANPSTNHGWIFVDDGNDGHGYYTSQYTNATQRPKLTVTYSTPVETRHRLHEKADNTGMLAAAVRALRQSCRGNRRALRIFPSAGRTAGWSWRGGCLARHPVRSTNCHRESISRG